MRLLYIINIVLTGQRKIQHMASVFQQHYQYNTIWGDIYKHDVEFHYYNIIDGKIVDLTKEQFDYDLDYSLGKKKQPSLVKAKTKKRFQILKEKIEKYDLKN